MVVIKPLENVYGIWYDLYPTLIKYMNDDEDNCLK